MKRDWEHSQTCPHSDGAMSRQGANPNWGLMERSEVLDLGVCDVCKSRNIATRNQSSGNVLVVVHQIVAVHHIRRMSE